MTPTLVVEMGRQALLICFLIAGPLLGIALAVGLMIGLVQAITQVQEQTLTFVPKLFAVAGLLAVMMPWMLRVLVEYTRALFLGLGALG